MPPSFSIIIETDNLIGHDGRILRRCLEALAQQTTAIQTANEVIAVYPDGDTKVEAQRLQAAFPWVRLLPTTEKLKYMEAKQIGVERSTGEIVVCIDSDCFAEPQWLAALLRRLEDPKVEAVAGDTAVLPNSPLALACAVSDVFYPYGRRPMPYRYFPDNMAIRRSTLAERPFHETDGFYRSATHVHRILEDGRLVVWEPKARVAHAPVPLGWFMQRFFFLGRDSARWRRTTYGRNAGAGFWASMRKQTDVVTRKTSWNLQAYPWAIVHAPLALPLVGLATACYTIGVVAAMASGDGPNGLVTATGR